MPTRQELENMGPAEVSTWCDKITESPNADPVARDQAWQLKRDWTALQSPSDPDVNMEKEKQKKLRIWKDEAVALIAALPPSSFARYAKP